MGMGEHVEAVGSLMMGKRAEVAVLSSQCSPRGAGKTRQQRLFESSMRLLQQ